MTQRQEDWKSAHEAAKQYIAALEEHKVYLRDEAVRIARDRDEWMHAYQAAMRPPEWLSEG